MMRLEWLLTILVVTSACGSDAPPPERIRRVMPDRVSIEGGAFRGTRLPCDLQPGQRGSHGVTVDLHVDAFEIDRMPVTCDAYEECVDAAQCPPIERDIVHSDLDGQPKGCDEGLAVVRADDAERYCAFVGGRLPSHLEIQRAVRGTTAWDYPDGRDVGGNCTRRSSHNPRWPRCRYTSKDGIEYMLRSFVEREHLGDRNCAPFLQDKDAQLPYRAYWFIGSELIDLFSSYRPTWLGYFRCSYPPGIELPTVLDVPESVPADAL